MARSRLERIRNRRAGKQGTFYLLLALVIGVAMLIWGLPVLARLAGFLIKTDNTPTELSELQPTPPIFSDVVEATFSATISVAGFAQPGVDVILHLNGAEIDRKLTSESGTFEFNELTLQDGDNSIFAYAETKKGVKSDQSKTYIIVRDNTKPTVTLSKPADGEVFRGQSQRITTFAGEVSEPGSRVYIGERMVIVQTDGKFNLPYQLVEGDQELQIRAIDKAGNEGVMTLKLRWEP